MEIDEVVSGLAVEINGVYEGKDLMLVGVLNGAFMFVSDLAKKLTIQPEIHFVKYSSYKGPTSTGQVKKELDLTIDLKGRHVLIVEDIVDTGHTLEQIVKDFQMRQPASLKVASLLFKPLAYKKTIPIDFIGREIPNDFVIGYGMDIDGKGRALRDIYRMK